MAGSDGRQYHAAMRGRTAHVTAGVVLATLGALLFVDWMFNAGPLPRTAPARSGLVLSVLLLSEDSPRLLHGIRAGLALSAIAGCVLAALMFLRARDSAPARQVAWMLVGYAGFVFAGHFLGVDLRYPMPPSPWLTSAMLATGALVFLVLAGARFLVIFPRPIDVEAVRRSYWLRNRVAQDYPIMDRWHAALQGGTALWMGPLMVVALAVLTRFLDSRGHAAGGVYFFALILGALFLALAGVPFAFASTTHLYRNGTAEERRRVAWLRGLLLVTGIALAGWLAAAIVVAHVPSLRASNLPAALLLLSMQLLPTAFMFALAFAVLYRGALDPRLVVSRVSLWTAMGFGVTAIFLVIERLVAVKAAQWLGVPDETGYVAAGAVVAATFFPLRRAVDRAVVRLADRLLPISVVADGVHVQRVVAITDLSGYTALSARDQPAALIQGALLKRQAERFVGPYEGQLVKSMGDAVMMTFGSAHNAVSAVRALHREYPRAALSLGFEPLPLHSALHRGEIVESHDGDIYGQTVNVAVRLVDAAGRGEVVMSDAVRAELGTGQATHDIGERRFKNVPEPLHCFRLVEESP